MSTASLGPSASEGGDELPSAISSDTSTTLVSAVGDGDGGPTSSQAGPTSLLTFQLSSIPASSTLSSLASSDPTTSSETATLPPESTSPESSPSSTSPSALEPVSSSSSTSPSALEPESSSSPSTSDVPSDSESSTVPTPSGVLTVTRSATGQPSFATGSASLLNPPSSSTSGVESGTTAEAAAADSTVRRHSSPRLVTPLTRRLGPGDPGSEVAGTPHWPRGVWG